MDITITTYLTEVQNGEEKYVVRMFDESGNLVKTRVVQSEEDAQRVKLEWQKQS